MSLVIDRVRERYPEYDNLSDSDLTLSLGQKFPQYLAADPTFKNEFDQASIGAVEHGLGVAMEAGGQVAKTIPLIQDAVSQPTPMEQDMAKVRDIVARRQNEQDTAEAKAAVGNPISFIVSSVKSRMLDEPVAELVSPLTTEEQDKFADHPRLLGAFESIRENANQLTTPKNLGLLAAGMGVGSIGPVAARAVSLSFAAMMAKQVPDIASQLGEEYAKPESERDQTKIAKLISDGAIATGFTALAGLHGVGEPIQKAIGSVPTLTPSPVLRNLAPLTAKALEEVPKTPKVNVELPKETPAVGSEPVAEPGPITPLVEAKGPLTGEEIPAAKPQTHTLELGDGFKALIDTGTDQIRYENEKGQGVGRLDTVEGPNGEILVENHSLEDEARGMGFGQKAIQKLSELTGKTIISDQNPSKSARAMWDRLGAKPEKVTLGQPGFEEEQTRYVLRPKPVEERTPDAGGIVSKLRSDLGLNEKQSNDLIQARDAWERGYVLRKALESKGYRYNNLSMPETGHNAAYLEGLTEAARSASKILNKPVHDPGVAEGGGGLIYGPNEPLEIPDIQDYLREKFGWKDKDFKDLFGDKPTRFSKEEIELQHKQYRNAFRKHIEDYNQWKEEWRNKAERELESSKQEKSTSKEREINASSIQQATEVHGDLQPPPEPSAEQVPTEKGGAGVQPQTEGGIQAPGSEGELTPEFDPKKKVQVTARGPDGEDMSVTMKAKEAVDRITKRKSALQALLDCLGGT